MGDKIPKGRILFSRDSWFASRIHPFSGHQGHVSGLKNSRSVAREFKAGASMLCTGGTKKASLKANCKADRDKRAEV